MTQIKEAIDRGLELYGRLVDEVAELRREFEESRQSFFRGCAPAGDAREADLAARRHLEWFLLERHSPSLSGLPAEALRDDWRERAREEDIEFAESFVDSRVGIYEVTDIELGVGAWLHDLAGFGEYPIEEPEGSKVLKPGDLVVGRLFPLGNSLYHVSSAAGFLRDPQVLEALSADIDRAREGRRGVLRLAQSELESMFWGAPLEAPPGPVAGARALLLEGGVAAPEVERILADLQRLPAEHLAPGGQDPLGDVLDRLAFDTAIDLDAARSVLLDAWHALSDEGPGTGPSLRPATRELAPSRGEIERAIADFDRGRENGEDLERLFASLEQSLAINEDGDAEGQDTVIPDFPGVVSAMVEEFLWETEQEGGVKAREELEDLRLFGQWASHVGVFENLGPKEVLTFLGLWLPESDDLRNAEDARRMLTAVRRFCRWSQERQQVTIHSGCGDALDGLLSSLPRIVEANRRRTRKSGIEQGEVFLLLAVESEGRVARVRDADGDEHLLAVDAHLLAWLRPEDRLRAQRSEDERLAVYCCYPAEVAALERLAEADEPSESTD